MPSSSDRRPPPKPALAPPPKPKPPIRPDDAIDLGRGAWVAKSAATFTFSRSSGPGGQNVNKVNTRAELTVQVAAIRNLSDAGRSRLLAMAGSHLIADSSTLRFVADEHRSQFDNREECLGRLRDLVTDAATLPKKRKKTKPSRGSKERRLDAKKREGDKKRMRGERF